MGLRIVYGKSGSGKSTFCFSEIANLINKEKKIYIITPEQFSFTAEKKLMDEIKSGAVINAEVITLSRMAYRVMQLVGGEARTKLTKCGKSMILYSTLNKYKKDFKFLNKSDENIDLCMSSISEFKKHGVTPQNLKDEIEKLDDEYLKAKLNDMFLVYQNFENIIQNEYIEDEDLLTYLVENVDKTDLLTDSVIYIDEFSGFTYQEYEILKKFIKNAKQVTLTVCTDSLNESLEPETDIYYSNKITIFKILNLVNEDNLILEKPIYLDQSPRFKNEELKFLEQNLFNIKQKKYEKNSDNIKLFLAKNQYSEIENVAKEIINLVKNENLNFNDISVITRNIDDYSSLIRSIFAEYNIPVFIDEKRDLNQNIIVQYLLSILEIFSSNFSKESIFNYLKIGFSDFDEDEIFKLENYCTKWGIKNNKWKNDFHFKSSENETEEIENLNNIRKEIINPLLNLKANFGTVEETTKAIYDFLQEQDFENKINKKIAELKEKNMLDLANEYVASYKIILNIFDEMVLVFGKEKIGLDKYIGILKTGLKNSELGKIPGTQDQVIVGDIERSRSHKVKAIFIIGVNDGKFPSVNKSEGFFDDKDREVFKQDGIELAKGTIENLYEENFNIYKAFTTAEERLYVSYASSDLEGKSLRQSVMISKIKRIFPNIIENSDIVNNNYQITNKLITYQELLENIANLRDGKKIEGIWYIVYQYYKMQNEYFEKLKNDIKGIEYTNIPENIDKNTIQKLYGNTLKTSISQLEKFAGCPFSFYLQYGLKLKEKEELKVQSFDTGSFMHETIDSFFKRTKEENINLSELVIDEEKIKEIVNKIIEEKLNENKKYTFVATAKYKVLVKRLERIVSKALKYILEGLVYSDFEIEGTEVEFGKNGKYNPITIELDDGKKVEITGKIDRIDTAKSDDGKYLRIIDYKSSAKNIDLNKVYAGLQIQLLTYMDAVCKEEDLLPAGVLYFSLLEQLIKENKKVPEEKIEEELRKNFKMKGLILADVKVIRMQDKNLETGTSKIIPATINKGDIISEKKTSGVSSEEFKILQDYIYRTIKELSKEILKGNIDIKPYNKNGEKPCKYCTYKAICGFNPDVAGNCYNYIPNYTKDEIIKKMK